jgi:hypothetical protein
VFALKGGTALNLFAREMPRLSVHFSEIESWRGAIPF